MIVTSDVAQSIVGMNIIGPRCLVMDPVTCTVDFRDKGTAASKGVIGQRVDDTIAYVRVLKATTIPGRHGQLLKLGLFNAERPNAAGHGHHGRGRQHGCHGRIFNAQPERVL
jgi:hypothetical protein